MNKPLRILLSSAGSRSVEAIIDCLKPVREQVYLIGTNTIPEFVSLAYLDAAYLVPPTASSAEYKAKMFEIVRFEKPDLIINGRDEEVPILAKISAETQVCFIGPNPEIANLFSNKYHTYLFCQKHQLPFVETAVEPHEIDRLIERVGFPLIVKPRQFGHASKDVFVLHHHHQVAHYAQQNNFIFQPFVAPAKVKQQFEAIANGQGIPWVLNPSNAYYNIDLLIGPKGEELSRCITASRRSGSVITGMQLSHDAYMHQLADRHVAVLSANAHRGPLNIQGYLNEQGEFQVFEWNARFVGSTYGFAMLGVNMVLEAVRHFSGRLKLEGPSLTGDGLLFRPMRYESVPMPVYTTLKATGTWHR
jgi:carbamoyl-phosphate synthase large subunit